MADYVELSYNGNVYRIYKNSDTTAPINKAVAEQLIKWLETQIGIDTI